MTQNGFREDQVAQVRGLADQRRRKRDARLDPLNLAISREAGWNGRGKRRGSIGREIRARARETRVHLRRPARRAQEGIELN